MARGHGNVPGINVTSWAMQVMGTTSILLPSTIWGAGTSGGLIEADFTGYFRAEVKKQGKLEQLLMQCWEMRMQWSGIGDSDWGLEALGIGWQWRMGWNDMWLLIGGDFPSPHWENKILSLLKPPFLLDNTFRPSSLCEQFLFSMGLWNQADLSSCWGSHVSITKSQQIIPMLYKFTPTHQLSSTDHPKCRKNLKKVFKWSWRTVYLVGAGYVFQLRQMCGWSNRQKLISQFLLCLWYVWCLQDTVTLLCICQYVLNAWRSAWIFFYV